MNKKLCITLLIILILSIIFVIVLKNQTPKTPSTTLTPTQEAIEVIKKFYNSYYYGDIEDSMKLIDFAGMEVYDQLGGKLQNFKETYDIYIKSDDWEEYDSQIKASWDSMVSNYKSSIENVELPDIELSNFKVQEVSTNLYKVTVDIKETNADGKVNESGEFAHYVFKNINNEYKVVYAEE
ncbi:MAG: hypothetical protein HFJ45_05580 [Clostridia bacterium]|nr:hypothetical protein [Clostridia bacterium]